MTQQVSVSYFLEKSIPAILTMLGSDRAPASFSKRTQLACFQKAFITEKKIPAAMFSAAENLIAVDGNIYQQKEGPSKPHKVFFVNSSRFLIQDNDLNKVSSSRIKALAAAPGPTHSYQAMRKICTSLHSVVRYEDTTAEGGKLFIFICTRCLGFQVNA